MELDRNRYFMIGVVLFLLGIQFRMVDSFVLNESTTKVLHRFVTKTEIAETNAATNMYVELGAPKKTIKPPKWLAFVLLTSGGVMALHALVLPRRN